jgi:hypothetical protein
VKEIGLRLKELKFCISEERVFEGEKKTTTQEWNCCNERAYIPTA